MTILCSPLKSYEYLWKEKLSIIAYNVNMSDARRIFTRIYHRTLYATTYIYFPFFLIVAWKKKLIWDNASYNTRRIEECVHMLVTFCFLTAHTHHCADDYLPQQEVSLMYSDEFTAFQGIILRLIAIQSLRLLWHKTLISPALNDCEMKTKRKSAVKMSMSSCEGP